MNQPRSRHFALIVLAAVVCWGLAAALLVGTAWNVWYVQQLKRQFAGYDMEVTGQQLQMIMLADAMMNFWFVMYPILLIACGLLVYAPIALWRRSAS